MALFFSGLGAGVVLSWTVKLWWHKERVVSTACEKCSAEEAARQSISGTAARCMEWEDR